MNLLNKPKLSVLEAIFAIIVIGFIVNGAFAYSDIVVHDNYILPIIADCYPDNQNEFCTKIREEQNCPEDSQSCIGVRYWVLLPQLVLLVAGATAILVMFLRVLGGAKINGLLILIGFAWFLTGVVLPYTGWGDFTYFILKNEPIPDELPWLNGAGFFPYFIEGENVTKDELYRLMGAGLIFLFIIWYGLTHLNKRYLKFVN